MNWHIGQKIVAVKDHPEGLFKKNNEFTVLGIRAAPCGCGSVELNLGVESDSPFQRCSKCDRFVPSGDKLWFWDKRFAPLDSHPELSELTDEDILQEIEEMEIQTA